MNVCFAVLVLGVSAISSGWFAAEVIADCGSRASRVPSKSVELSGQCLFG